MSKVEERGGVQGERTEASGFSWREAFSAASLCTVPYAGTSPWLLHAPWCAWMLDHLRPDQALLIGGADDAPRQWLGGAARMLGLAVQLFDLNLRAAPSNAMPAAAIPYPGLVETLPRDGWERRFARASLRLVLIDAATAGPTLSVVWEALPSLLAPDAVVLVHGDLAGRDERHASCLRFHAGHGLRVEVRGEPTPLLATLAACDDNATELAALRRLYAKLGNATMAECASARQLQRGLPVAGLEDGSGIAVEARDGSGDVAFDQMRGELDSALASRDAMARELEQVRAESAHALNQAQATIHARMADIAVLTNRLMHVERDLIWRTRDVEDLQHEVGDLAARETVARPRDERPAPIVVKSAPPVAIQMLLKPAPPVIPQNAPRRLAARLLGRGEYALVKLLRESEFFDREYYVAANPDVAAQPLSAELHFIRHGGYEGRDPSTRFSTLDYLRANPDVAEAGANALLHYLTKGRAEGRPLR